MKAILVGEPPFLDELTRLAQAGGHKVTAFLPPDVMRVEEETEVQAKFADADVAVVCSVFSPYTVADVDELLPVERPILFLALAASATEACWWTQHPGRLVGWGALPPLAPERGEKLVEVARSLRTEEKHFEAALAFWASVGLEPVEVADGPGLVRARVLCCLINEAVSALADGIASPQDIDAAMRLGNNYPRGLLAWADELGIDTVLAVLEGLHRESGDPAYRPHPLLKRKVWAGHLGKVSGRGFHEYDAPK